MLLILSILRTIQPLIAFCDVQGMEGAGKRKYILQC